MAGSSWGTKPLFLSPLSFLGPANFLLATFCPAPLLPRSRRLGGASNGCSAIVLVVPGGASEGCAQGHRVVWTLSFVGLWLLPVSYNNGRFFLPLKRVPSGMLFLFSDPKKRFFPSRTLPYALPHISAFSTMPLWGAGSGLAWGSRWGCVCR